MPPHASNPKEKSWSSAKRRWMGWGLFLLVTLGIPGVALFLPIWDSKPFDDTGMWVVPDPVSDEENAWPLLEELYTSVGEVYHDRVYYDWIRDPDAHLDEINAWLTTRNIMGRFSEILDKPYCVPPFHREVAREIFYNDVQEFAFRVLRLNLYGQSEAQARLEAWRACLTFLHQCGGSYSGITLFSGRMHFHAILFSDLKADPFVSQFSEKQLGELLDLYTQLESDLSEEFAWALLHSYQIQVQVLKDQGLEGYWEEFLARRGKPAPWIANKWMFAYTYQPNRTQAWICEAHQAALYQLAPDIFDFPSAREWTDIPEKDMIDEGIGVIFTMINVHGKVAFFLQLFPPTIHNIENAMRNYQLNRLSGQLFLALLKYERAFGTLPASISELVPDTFPQLPMDPYDGLPMRYQPTQRRFYSVGQDGVDQGGLDKPGAWNGDIVVTLPTLKETHDRHR